MEESKNKKEKGIVENFLAKGIPTITALILLVLGAIIILWYLYHNKGEYSNSGIISPVTVIFMGGIILLIGSEVLHIAYKKRISELIQNDTDIKEHLKQLFKELLNNDDVKPFLTKGIEYFVSETINKSEEVEKTNNEMEVLTAKEKYKDFDTVIVPVTYSVETIKLNLEYTCPSGRKFKDGLQYIAFYKSKEIVGYGKISVDYPKIDKEKDLKIFKIEKFIDKSIPHMGNYAFAQNKRYCKSIDLTNADITSTQELIY